MAGIGIDTTNVNQTVSNANTSNSNSSLDKDAFLKLLVTQMQYQDPLEPTSNTEYMSQLAQFSTVEELQNLSTTFSNNQAMNLTGQYVILNVPDSTGEVNQISGLVDYVTLSDGKTYLHVNEEYYPSDYLDSVVSIDYLEHLINSADQTETDTEGADSDKTEGTESGSNDSGNSEGTDGTDNV
ncbi:MAG: flagellar hook assembly protein FlgD [Lachnospiraceae bacterium]